jgi:hypothetical protein
MPNQNTSTIVPAEIAGDVEDIVDAIKTVAEQQGKPWDSEIRVVRPQGKQMIPGAMETLFLICSTTGATWFTRKWIDAFVWPEIEKRIRKPSQKAVEFVFAKIPQHAKDGGERESSQSAGSS